MKEKVNSYVFCKFHNELDHICEKLNCVSIFDRKSNEFNLVMKKDLHERLLLREFDTVPTGTITIWDESSSFIKLLANMIEWLTDDESREYYSDVGGYENVIELVRNQYQRELAREIEKISIKDIKRYDDCIRVLFTYSKQNQLYMKYLDKSISVASLKEYLATHVDEYYQNPSLIYVPKWLQLIIRDTFINGDISISMEQLQSYEIDKKNLKRTCSEYGIEELFEIYDDVIEVNRKLVECFELFGVHTVK